jgi:hypothetical protein
MLFVLLIITKFTAGIQEYYFGRWVLHSSGRWDVYFFFWTMGSLNVGEFTFPEDGQYKFTFSEEGKFTRIVRWGTYILRRSAVNFSGRTADVNKGTLMGPSMIYRMKSDHPLIPASATT